MQVTIIHNTKGMGSAPHCPEGQGHGKYFSSRHPVPKPKYSPTVFPSGAAVCATMGP